MGATVAVAFLPWKTGFLKKIAVMAVFVFLANLPDAPVPWWGHTRYDISHSIFVNGLLAAAVAVPLAFYLRSRRVAGAGTLVAGGALAWLSHLLLDTFYNHGKGLAVFWPFGSGRVALPVPWFKTLNGHPLLPQIDAYTARLYLIEMAFYGTLFALALVIRWLIERRFSRRTAAG